MNSATPSPPSVSGPWWRELNGYHWFVFLLAAFGWMFDCFDQQIFTMSRSITMRDLMPQAEPLAQLRYGNWATSIFIIVLDARASKPEGRSVSFAKIPSGGKWLICRL